MSTVHVAVVSTRSAAPLARATVRRALGAAPAAQVHVLDVDGTYAPTALESVLSPLDVGVRPADLHLQAMVHEPAALAHALYPALVRAILAGTPSGATATVLVAQPGVLLLNPPTAVLDDAERDGLCLLARTPSPVPDDGLWPSVADVVQAGAHAPTMLALHGAQTGLLDLWERAMDQPDDTGAHWLDVVAAQVAHHTVRDAATLLSPWTLRRDHRVTDDDAGLLRLDGRPVVALDLSALDPTRPWLLDAEVSGDPRGRLSDHPVLARLVDRLAADLRADAADLAEGRPGAWDMTTTSLGTPVDAPTRGLYRTAAAAGQPAPDPFDPAAAAELRAWLTDVDPDGGPGRYLRALHRTRPDLQRAFPKVPGASTVGFLNWVRTYGHDESYPADLLDLALSQVEARSAEAPRGAERLVRGRTPHGVNVVGYLRGELGIGESARLMVSALQAAGVAHSSVPIDQNLLSRQRPGPSDADAGRRQQVFDTSLICVNADLTPTVAGSVPELLSRSYRIGMWYWEVEDFGTQRDGFAHVDEVWTATDFVRHAIEPHSPVPVRTVTPPLPQRGPEPTLTRADLGLPERPVFLFSFDFLSTAERKNPIGLIDAFTTAFARGEGPALVIKSINAGQRPAEAERLRLRAATEPDVMLMEDYLDATERDAMVALCDVYVSLHRSEGLGLTMAEAMAWGKPVIATGYSGNLQFMTEQNSFLVPWTPARIPVGADPYPAGGTWADPDLDAAARLMRSAIEEPDVAAARGARAARDIATLHSPEVAGRQIVDRLADSAGRRRARLRTNLGERLRSTARRLR